MTTQTYMIALDGGVLQRGFWLYVWEIIAPTREEFLYVGRTGDSSSANAQSPFNRMGQHLGFSQTSSMLRNHLSKRNVRPEQCTFRLIAHGPILAEASSTEAHKQSRDLIAAMEKKLAEDLAAAGYKVMNEVKCHKPLDEKMYATVRAAFRAEFHRL
jgi:hypothetical protein